MRRRPRNHNSHTLCALTASARRDTIMYTHLAHKKGPTPRCSPVSVRRAVKCTSSTFDFMIVDVARARACFVLCLLLCPLMVHMVFAHCCVILSGWLVGSVWRNPRAVRQECGVGTNIRQSVKCISHIYYETTRAPVIPFRRLADDRDFF